MSSSYLKLRSSQEDEYLSKYATKSINSMGRLHRLEPCVVRTEFERDHTRILHSLAFRRLRHKTQVFFSPKNDHICTRMEHSLHVTSIALTIALCLRLNCDLVRAIAYGHDIGHPPFGHATERELDRLAKHYSLAGFCHEAHGLRVVDRYKETEERHTLNLTFEVRDGIACHCGEQFERVIEPTRKDSKDNLYNHAFSHTPPATIEGCLVRMVDKVAYLGRDFEDAIRAGIIKKEQLPKSIKDGLGQSNSDFIGTFVTDIVENSVDKNRIEMSEDVNSLMVELDKFNRDFIYQGRELSFNEKSARRIIAALFDNLGSITRDFRKLDDSEDLAQQYKDFQVYRSYRDFIKGMQYDQDEPDALIAIDYIAGMTDNFALRAFEELYMLRPIV